MNKIVILFTVLLIIVAGIGIFAKINFAGIVPTNTETDSNIEELLALPYLSYVEDDPNPEKKGVTLYNKNLSYEGMALSQNPVISNFSPVILS